MSRETTSVTRRDFLRVVAVGGGAFCLGVSWPGRAAAAGTGAESWRPGAFVRLEPDGRVVVISKHTEMGQGVFTTLALAVAEELDVPWTSVAVETEPADPKFAHLHSKFQMTGGSSSTREALDSMRLAGGTARAVLVQAAAERWGVAVERLRTEAGQVLADDGRTAAYGSLLAAAARLPLPDTVPLKPRSEWRLLGRDASRVEAADKVTGRALFGFDVTVPGLKTVLIARAPRFGAVLEAWDDTAARRLPGVLAVVPVWSGVAVVAEGFLAAQRGREALVTRWSPGPIADWDEARIDAVFAEAIAAPGLSAQQSGDFAAAWTDAARRIEATFDLPYLAHACMEPLNATAWLRPDGMLEVWAPTHFPGPDRDAAAQVAGLSLERVILHPCLMGGSFGRKAAATSDFVREAVDVARQVKWPVKVVWTREDDLRGGFYRPRVKARVRLALAADGALAGWGIDTAGQRMSTTGSFASDPTQVEGSMVEGLTEPGYAIPHREVVWHEVKAGPTVQWWRSVGHSTAGFIKECAIDLAAEAAGVDPLLFRERLLADAPRALTVLRTLREVAEWGRPAPGRFQGVAFHESFGTLVGQVVDVSVGPQGEPKVHRVVCVVDCGWVVNPTGAKAQVMSSVIFGLSAALYGRIDVRGGATANGNFHDYPVMRLPEAPVVETVFVESDGPLSGLGEPGLPPVAAALANAWFKATGKRVTRLPFVG